MNNISRAWSFRFTNEESCIVGELTYMDKTYANIKVTKHCSQGIAYGIESFESCKDVTDDDKRLLINHIVVNLLLLEGKNLTLPLLYLKQPTDDNLNFIIGYLSGGFPILKTF